MKITIPLVSESMTPEAYMRDADYACDYLNSSLNKVFDENFTVSISKPNGKTFGNHISISIYNVPVGSTSLQMLNAKMGIRFMLHLTNDSGRQVDMKTFDLELLTMSYQVKAKGLKYRKISGVSPTACCTKLVQWVKKNEAIIKSL
jgi:hypothetical protein